MGRLNIVGLWPDGVVRGPTATEVPSLSMDDLDVVAMEGLVTYAEWDGRLWEPLEPRTSALREATDWWGDFLTAVLSDPLLTRGSSREVAARGWGAYAQVLHGTAVRAHERLVPHVGDEPADVVRSVAPCVFVDGFPWISSGGPSVGIATEHTGRVVYRGPGWADLGAGLHRDTRNDFDLRVPAIHADTVCEALGLPPLGAAPRTPPAPDVEFTRRGGLAGAPLRGDLARAASFGADPATVVRVTALHAMRAKVAYRRPGRMEDEEIRLLAEWTTLHDVERLAPSPWGRVHHDPAVTTVADYDDMAVTASVEAMTRLAGRPMSGRQDLEFQKAAAEFRTATRIADAVARTAPSPRPQGAGAGASGPGVA